MGDEEKETDESYSISAATRRDIISSLQELFHEHNSVAKLFKTAPEQTPSNEYEVIIKADRIHEGAHERICNEPTRDDIAISIMMSSLSTSETQN